VRFYDQCNPTCGGFVCDRGALDKRLVMTHLKAPFEFRLIGMQEENKVIFFVKLFLM
jgi:Zn-finger nucleic acid-binding protein